jgi:centrosomal protein CEP164
MNKVLNEEVDLLYEPSQQEIADYAEWLGMDLQEDEDLLWIARAGLKQPLPNPWRPCQTENDEIFYFNFETGESVWDHPMDEHHRKLYVAEKEKRKIKIVATLESSLLESGFVHVCTTSMGGNELASLEMPHTDHTFRWLQQKLNHIAGKDMQFMVGDRLLGAPDLKTPLCEILGITIDRGADENCGAECQACPECARPMEWTNHDEGANQHGWQCLCKGKDIRLNKERAGFLLYRWHCQDCDTNICSHCLPNKAKERRKKSKRIEETAAIEKFSAPIELAPLKGCHLLKAKHNMRLSRSDAGESSSRSNGSSNSSCSKAS